MEVSHDHLHNHTARVHLEIDSMGGKMSTLEKGGGGVKPCVYVPFSGSL